MTGIERLRKLESFFEHLSGLVHYGGEPLCDVLHSIASQIEREQEALVRETEDVSGRDSDALAWVEEHGGLESVRKMAAITLDVYQRFVDGNAGPEMLETDADTVDSMMAEIVEAIVRRDKERTRALELLDESVPRVTYERHIIKRQRQINESHAALRRRNERIARMGKTIEFFQLNNSNFRHLLADVAERLGFTRYGDDYEPEDLLDALDHRLMPEGMEWLVEAWPRFEDDTPLCIGEDVNTNRGVCTVKSVRLYDGSFTLYGEDKHGLFEVCHISWQDGERVKRPAPKVLDADGAEIRVGDTVWDTEFGCEFVVTKVAVDTVFVAFEDVEADRRDPASLTHRAPVLAADGRPLREGETVWGVVLGIEMTVDKVSSNAVHLHDAKGLEYKIMPQSLTHERPETDSWERLEEDAKKPTCVYFDQSHGCGGCPHYPSKCHADKVLDIVRRAKRLAGDA